MSLKLIYGAATSKKTEKLYLELISQAEQHPEQNYILLVPEQASLSAQEALVNLHPRHALSNIDILTFNRLAFRVFEQNGVESHETIDELGKIMLLRLVVGRNEKNLTVLRRGIHRLGMLSQLKSVISELVQYNITPEELKKQTEKLDGHKALQSKLADIALIYEEFLKVVHQKHELMEERPMRLAGEIKNWKQAGITTIAMDDYTGFTPPQYAVITELMKRCPQVISTITVGTGEELKNHKDESDLFFMSAHMAERLKEIAIRAGQEIQEEAVSDEIAHTAAISHVERNLYRIPEASFPDETDCVRFVRANKSRDEIAYVLHEIMKDVRNGYRYRDIAVISGALSEDRDEIEAQFHAAGISFFIDERRSIRNNPITLFIQSALNVIENKFGFDSVFGFAKNPLVLYHLRDLSDPLYYKPFERVAEVENLALARGFRSRKAYERDWTTTSKNFDETRFPYINEAKDRFIAGLLKFDDEMKASRTAADRISAIQQLLSDYKVEEGLSYLAKKIRDEAENELLALEYEQLFGVTQKLLTEFRDLLATEAVPKDLFTEILMAGLQSMVMRHVPPTKDRVVVGDLKRTRLNHIKKLYVLRTNEGILPEKHEGSGLINDHDREILRENEVSLSETAREQAFNDRFYLYLLLTKPTESLCVSYCLNNKDGKGIFPSELVGRLRRMFPDAPVVSSNDRPLNLVNSPYDALEFLAKSLTEFKAVRRERILSGGQEENGPTVNEEARAIYHQLLAASEDWKVPISQIFEGLFYFHEDERLSKTITKGLYTDALTGSVTLLESYAECPYKHFLNYGLGLTKKEVYRVEPSDLGSMLHNSIEGFFRLSEAENLAWHDMNEEDHRRILQTAVDEAVEGQRDAILFDSAKNQYVKTRIERITERTLWALKRQWDTGSFEKTKTEIPFGKEKELPPIHILLDEGQELVLQGRIDRLDTAEDDAHVYLKIVDYKSSDKDLDFTKVYYGLQLQLLLYMGAATKAAKEKSPQKEVLPVGVYYYGMDDPMIDGEQPADVSEEEWTERISEVIYDKLKMKGLTNSNPEIFSKVDKNLEADLVSSLISGLKYVKKKDAYESAADTETIERLEEFVLSKSREIAGQILGGEIPVRPYRWDKDHGCKYCDYRSVCGFDTRLDGYRELRCQGKTLEDIVNPQDKEMEPQETSTSADQAEGGEANG